MHLSNVITTWSAALVKDGSAGGEQASAKRRDTLRNPNDAQRARPCQPSPSFCFKVTMSGSNALRPLTFFWE
jgi:hypothetical protein